MAKLVERNITENWASVSQQQQQQTSSGGSKSRKGGPSKQKDKSGGGGAEAGGPGPGERLVFRALDWETDTPTSSLAHPVSSSFDLVLACDCIYNEALVDPFVSTCVDICKLRRHSDTTVAAGDKKRPAAVVVVAQVLRDSDVFNAWIKRFVQDFRCWRVPDEMMIDELKSEGQGGSGGGGGTSGFVVHVGVLREGR